MNLTKAIIIATKSHHGQKDKSGEPYILHPLRVMNALSGVGWPDDVLIVAVLHDVLEDTNTTVDALERAGFSHQVIVALLSVTRTKYESYADYLARAKANWIGRVVKIADLKDNLIWERLEKLHPEMRRNLKKRYETALEVMG